ncbi:preprotein translocase subunit SecG [Weeksellaceae bacterium TAE3-ERU29]|nr:preprotein translocase subunit SecG [Weeksellaceae bacterium TAE3-ERU29]
MTTFIFLMIVVMIVCALLIMVILSQNPKGGGLSSTFGGGGSQMFGVQRTNDFLDKATWTLAIAIVVLVVVSTFVIPRNSAYGTPDVIIDQENAIPTAPTPDTTPMPNAPAQTPASNIPTE